MKFKTKFLPQPSSLIKDDSFYRIPSEIAQELDKFLGFVKLCVGGRKMGSYFFPFNPFLIP